MHFPGLWGAPRPVRRRREGRLDGNPPPGGWYSLASRTPSARTEEDFRACLRARGPPSPVVVPREDCPAVLSAAGRRDGGGRPRDGAQGPWRICRHPVRPVLKHGPRSLTCARVKGSYETQGRNESEGRPPRPAQVGSLLCEGGAPPARLVRSVGEAEQERARWDPKDGELCLSRSRPEETLVEDRSDSDVQIDRPTWV